MISCYLACVADKAIINETNKALTLVEVIDGLDVPIFPSVIPRLFVAFFLEKSPNDPASVPMHLQIVAGQTVVLDSAVEVVFTQDRTKAVFELHGVPITQAGEVTFALLDGANRLGAWNVKVRQVPQLVPPAGVAVPVGAAPAQQ